MPQTPQNNPENKLQEFTKPNLYRLLAANLGMHPKALIPKTPLSQTGHFDSLSIFEFPLIVEDRFGVFVDVPASLATATLTGEELVNYIYTEGSK